jgi:DnaJ-class molecular chaperone
MAPPTPVVVATVAAVTAAAHHHGSHVDAAAVTSERIGGRGGPWGVIPSRPWGVLPSRHLTGSILQHARLSSTTAPSSPLVPSSAASIPIITALRGGGGEANPNSSASSKETKASSTTAGGATPKRRRASANTSKPKSETARSPKGKSTSSSSSTLPIVQEILSQDDYYQILGITKEAVAKSAKPETVITKAYRRRAVQTHPDKTGGDRRAFDKVAEAHDVLSDPSRRQIYNRYGKKGIEAASGHGGSGGTASRGGPAGMSGMRPEDLFSTFFGSSSSPFGQQFRAHHNRSVRYELSVTLEDLYRGRTMEVVLPGSRNNKTVSITIPRGTLHNQEITASGVMDSDSSQPPGDAQFRISQQPHATFTRKGHDLAIPLEISLAEAISGVARTIRHLDGRAITIVSAAASAKSGSDASPAVIATGDVHVLKGEGMPKDALGTEFGDLYVQYTVSLPKPGKASFLTSEERHELDRLLRKLEGKKTASTSSQWPLFGKQQAHQLQLASASDFGKSARGSGHEFDNEQQQQPGQQQRFYWSSSSSFSGHPFFGSTDHAEDDNDLHQQPECRQM